MYARARVVRTRAPRRRYNARRVRVARTFKRENALVSMSKINSTTSRGTRENGSGNIYAAPAVLSCARTPAEGHRVSTATETNRNGSGQFRWADPENRTLVRRAGRVPAGFALIRGVMKKINNLPGPRRRRM